MGEFTALDRSAASQYGVLTTEQLLRSGLTRRQIRRRAEQSKLTRLGPGVYRVRASPMSWEQNLAAATLAGHPLAAASHRSAARLWHFRTVDDELEVSIRYPRQLAVPGVTVHRSRDLLPRDVTWVDGIRTTTPRRTLCDLGLIFPEHEVHRMVRHAVATGLVTKSELLEVRQRNGKQGRNGVGVLDRCIDRLPDQAASTESGLEVMFLELCEEFALPAPICQLPIRTSGHNYRVDFAYPNERLSIEIDGIEAHNSPKQRRADARRTQHLTAAGWTELRFDYAALRDHPAACARQIRRTLDL